MDERPEQYVREVGVVIKGQQEGAFWQEKRSVWTGYKEKGYRITHTHTEVTTTTSTEEIQIDM